MSIINKTQQFWVTKLYKFIVPNTYLRSTVPQFICGIFKFLTMYEKPQYFIHKTITKIKPTQLYKLLECIETNI